jgi:superfamily I DNA/RNA helicase
MSDLRLNEEQNRAVLAKGSTLVEAWAVAGKTRTLVAKAMMEAEKRGRSVYVVTFTVSAAEEIVKRLKELEIKESPKHVGTLHSFCLSLIRWVCNENELVDDAALEVAMIELAKRLRIRISQRRMRELAAGDEPMDGPERTFADAFHKTMKEYGLLTYDGILEAAWALLGTTAMPSWKNSIFLIDEVQDSSALDLKIYEALLAHGAELWMVGDLQQAIYSFRHPTPVNVWEWWQRLSKGDVRELPTNYRSSVAVVNALNVINRDFVPRLEARAPEGTVPGETTLIKAKDEAELFVKLSARIEELEVKYDSGPEEFAVLCRTNRECEKTAAALSWLPLKVKDAARAERVSQRLWAALGFYRQPQSDWMASRYLRTIGADDRAAQQAAAKAMRPMGYLIYPALFAVERSKEAWIKWMDLLLVPKPEQAWFYERMPEDWKTTLSWDEIVMRLFEAPLAEEKGEGVTVTTVHSAKGREWRHVLMPFCDQQSYRPKNGVEEMRVFFVGASRAIETLTFLVSATRADEFKGGTRAVAMHAGLEGLVQAGKKKQ